MFNKLYENIKNYIIDNYKSLLIIIVIFIFFMIRLPFYISAPGGILNTKDKMVVENNFELKGSLNMAYVSQMDGSIPMLLYAVLNPDWDIESRESVTSGSESPEDMEYRNKLLLKEANDTAVLVAFDHADVAYKTENHKIYVTYIDDLAQTTLKYKDQIVKIDDKKVLKKQDLYDYIGSKKVNDKVKFTVIRNNKEVVAEATLIDVKGEAKVGIVITETLDIKSDEHIDFSFKDSESGSSGGLMMALTVYSYVNKIDLTKGKKIVGTGTIDKNGNVGPIDGIKYKLIGAVRKKSDVFLVPQGENYIEARNLKNKKGYKIDIVPVETFDEALKYLKS